MRLPARVRLPAHRAVRLSRRYGAHYVQLIGEKPGLYNATAVSAVTAGKTVIAVAVEPQKAAEDMVRATRLPTIVPAELTPLSLPERLRKYPPLNAKCDIVCCFAGG